MATGLVDIFAEEFGILLPDNEDNVAYSELAHMLPFGIGHLNSPLNRLPPGATRLDRRYNRRYSILQGQHCKNPPDLPCLQRHRHPIALQKHQHLS